MPRENKVVPVLDPVYRQSWVEMEDSPGEMEGLDITLDYLRHHPSAALPPSPLSPSSLGRPRAPTPSAAVSSMHQDCWNQFALDSSDSMASSETATPDYTDSPLSYHSSSSSLLPPHVPHFSSRSPLLRSVSEGETSFLDELQPQRSFARPPKSIPLPDPSQFPDPYPFRPPHHHLTSTTPALSSAGSSSASTRSSAYTSSGSALASGDYGHVHVASGDDEATVGVGITSDAVVQLLADDSMTSSSSRAPSTRLPVDQTRWSESYSASIRSRSSSTGNSNENSNNAPQRLQEKPGYDVGWQAVDERDETGVSEEDTDDDNLPEGDEDEDEDREEERTSAAVIAEEGRGLIVQGDDTALSDLHVQSGTTHLIVGSSTTPNAMPSFLTNTIPQICNTLLALDISANFLGALPPCLAMCYLLEELNIASNPLRVVPVFLSELTNLRVLIADATGISNLPDCLADLDKLHTISIRRNKMHSLPSWLCLLPALQTLYVDGNPFQGPWKALVEPLLAKVPMSPVYPPSTPSFPPLGTPGLQSSSTSTDEADGDDLSDPSSADLSGQFSNSPEEEHTITPERAPPLNRVATAPPEQQGQRGLQRTRTTPNRAFHEQSRVKSIASSSEPRVPPASSISNRPAEDAGYFGDREVRKMKSAGDLRRVKALGPSTPDLRITSPQPPVHQGIPSSSSSPLIRTTLDDQPTMAKRFASLGPSVVSTPSRSPNGSRPALTKSLWDGVLENETDSPSPSNRASLVGENLPILPQSLSRVRPPPLPLGVQDKPISPPQRVKEAKEKSSRWGFLKKMSMGKIKPDSPSRLATVHGRLGRPNTAAGPMPSSDSMPILPAVRMSSSPLIDVRLSTTGTLDVTPPTGHLSPIPSPQFLPRSNNASTDALKVPSSSNLLAPPSPAGRSSKRRSFLPIDAPPSLNIPDSSPFVSGMTATNGPDDIDMRNNTPSPVDIEHHIRLEEERAREAYSRALRSVMAYLKDMNDLALSQQPNPISMYGSPEDSPSSARSRRPTVSDASREVSMAMSSIDSYGQLRSAESIAVIRSGCSTQTHSVATTDSTSSTDERKFKDDKAKRTMIIREIVATERTYVKGLEELMDIYIKPASVPVNILSGVGSGKDTVVPISERKIVFNGLDALFSFHKGSFLPALEAAAAPLMKSPVDPKQADADGQLSLNVAKAVGNMFLKHAAFMKMYSSYINNFDNSVQRVKHWTSNRAAPTSPSPGGGTPLSSSTSQLVGLGLTMTAISHPGIMPDAGTSVSGLPNLSTSQRKRIRSYLKRCRLSPRHSQLNLEGYLLLPVQRIPRYRLLLDELLRSTPPSVDYTDDPLERALTEISSLANNMNEGKRESESRRKLVQWQSRIRGKFPSPLVQPHRRLIMDGPLLLTRVVRKTTVAYEAINAQGDASTVQVDCLAPELTPRPLMGILCNDLLVLCRDPSDGQDPNSFVDLWAVLRMQTLPQPASIVHGNALRLVDNKAILYFEAPSPSDALNWYRAINLHIPASKA